ncbi:MFS transporter [Alcaligenes faecalis]|uniref:MFS transporter n=1 Tax=Alcaligenes faecalis TaxID=511 RepID=UPI001D1700B6|nr:MFS transporter [Alcaligenes faecalis]
MAASTLARLALPMTTIGIVAMLSQTHGQYWLAGAVSALFAIANAFIAPRISKWVDAKGQAAVLRPATLVTLLALLGLAAAAHQDWPIWTFFVCALLAGVMPSMAALSRARWAEMFRGKPQLHTAFSFESIVDEIAYICGPVFGIGLSVSLFPEAGVLSSAFFLAIGSFWLSSQKATEPPTKNQSGLITSSVLNYPAVWIVALMFAGMGCIVGTAEVAVVALTEAQAQKGAATYILSANAVGSFLVGIVFGTMSFKSSLTQRLLYAALIATLMTLPLPFTNSLGLLAFLYFLSGASLSPTFISGFGLIEHTVPSSQLTEGITYAQTGLLLGFAFGSTATGWVVDAYGPSSGFWVAVGGGVAALLTIAGGYKHLSSVSTQQASAA